ncbi:hypothetical protein BH11MYX3_BH11MYX3_39090 [soil metagenome]
MKGQWIAAVLVVASGTAAAGPLGDALGKSDVAGLRNQLGDPAARCTLGAVFAKQADLPRAALYLTGCGELTLPEDVAEPVARAAREVIKKLRASELSQLEIVTNPDHLFVEFDALPGEQIVAPASVWVKAGAHTVKATFEGQQFTNSVTLAEYARGAVFMDLVTPKAPPPTGKDRNLDFADENAVDKNDGPPPDVKRRSMVSDKLLGIAGEPSGDAIADPLATAPPPQPLPLWLGVRLGGGMFDDGAATARVRPSVAAAARYTLSGPAFLAARFDWTRRGGEGDAAVDVLGASAGAGYSVL